MSLMRLVWTLTILYSGLVGLSVYFYSGRKEIPKDNVWRKGFRSVAHCYSGCGMGEITGIFIAAGLLTLANIWVALITFSLAFLAGYTLTAYPLIQEGQNPKSAYKDALYSESLSIAVMEIVAIGVDLWLAGDATMNETLFWSSLIFSLSIGLIAAYPVNVWLINKGIKQGMHSPKMINE